MLQVEHLTKVYENGTVALEDVSFTVPDGQFLAIIGLSGSGKSTLLRCVNRLIEPTEDASCGTVRTSRPLPKRISAVPAAGMVFQHFNLVHRSKVLTNVLAGRLGYTNPAMSLVNRFSKETWSPLWPSSSVGLQDKAYARADELSGGQQHGGHRPGTDAEPGDDPG